MNIWSISVTAETSQDPIGPRGPLEQSLDSGRHPPMAAWSSALDFGVHPVVEDYYSGHALGVRLGVRTIIRVRVRLRVTIKVRSALGCNAVGARSVGVL